MLPTNFEDKTVFFKAYNKTLNRIIPSTGQQDILPASTTIFSLPQASVLDMKSFRLNFHGKTNGTSTDTVLFPKFIASLIERMEIFVNGVSIQNITNYGVIYQIMRNYSKDFEKYDRKLNNNSHPEKFETMTDAGVVTTTDARSATTGVLLANTQERDYCIDDWVGFLDTCPEFFNTNLVGNVEIHITWASATCLASANVTSPSYTLSNMYAFVDVVHFKDDSYINELDRKLSVNGELVIPYKNYRCYLGASLTNTKATTLRITESSQSIDKVMLTFLPTTRTTRGGWNTSVNNTNYYELSGLGLGYNTTHTASGTVQWEINSQDVSNPLSFPEVYQETIKAFELDRDGNAKHGNPAITPALYEKSFFVACLSTSHLNAPDETKTIVSGMDSQATALQIACKTKNGRATDNAQAGQPLMITEMTALLRIGGGRQISVMF